jgi:hypothetical protein
LANFYRRWIKGFSGVAAPLTDLLKGKLGGSLAWSPECQDAFDELKRRLVAAPLLVQPDPDARKRVESDASGFAIGAVLLQEENDGTWHPVAYFSKKLSKPQQDYPVHEQELFALVEALQHWRPYLMGMEIRAVTDHLSLKHFPTQKNLSGRQARWSISLQDFNVSIDYRPGKKHIVADCLSRRADIRVAATRVITNVKADFLGDVRELLPSDEYFGPIWRRLMFGGANIVVPTGTAKVLAGPDGEDLIARSGRFTLRDGLL